MIGKGCRLREAGPADVWQVWRLIRALAAYEHLLHQATATEADLARILFGPRPLAWAVLAEADGEQTAVGLALWYYSLSSFAARPKLFVEDVFVEPAWRRRGIGLALFRYLAVRAQAEGCWGMEWRVLNWNEGALGFYRRIGARVVADWTIQQLTGPALAAVASGRDGEGEQRDGGSDV